MANDNRYTRFHNTGLMYRYLLDSVSCETFVPRFTAILLLNIEIANTQYIHVIHLNRTYNAQLWRDDVCCIISSTETHFQNDTVTNRRLEIQKSKRSRRFKKRSRYLITINNFEYSRKDLLEQEIQN